MAQIEFLPPTVVDQIAAGEVVERPAHLVKELVENSLDAGARTVDVEYDQGGRWVRVNDDGHGMLADDLSKALARHATSKIRKAEDLFRLSSFGFRGEALASIAAVSRLEMISKTKEDSTAHRIAADFGQMEALAASGGGDGTSIQISDLFANLPARLKFLKSETAEHTQIRMTLKALALANPQVTFRLKCKGKLEAVWPSCVELQKRAEQVLENGPMHLGQIHLQGVEVQCAVGSPHLVTGNSRQIWLFAQDRWIQDRSLQAAVLDAYRGLLMHGEFPYAVIKVWVASQDIDVNIHPTKSQVKLAQPAQVFRAVQACVRQVLESAPWLQNGQRQAPAPVLRQEISAEPAHLRQMPLESNPRIDMEPSDNMERVVPAFAERNVGYVAPLQSTTAAAPYWSSLRILAQAKATYVVAESDDGLWLIDQHAAHERVAYEKLVRAWKQGGLETQELLFPLSIELQEEQVEALILRAEEIERVGIRLGRLGPGVLAVESIPSILKESAVVEGLKLCAHELAEQHGSHAVEKVFLQVFASMACHSVVRAGQRLELDEMRELLCQMDEFPLSSFCPHGRPVSVKKKWPEIERDFGRIV